MFSRKDQLLRKTGPDGIGRYDFLRLLKKEFEETANEDSKYQTLANLANFAYDPINYDYIRSLRLIDLFLEHLSSDNELLVKFSIAAVCNLSSDPKNKCIIIQNNGVDLISQLLWNEDQEIISNAITTMIFLKQESFESYPQNVVDKISEFRKSNCLRLSNLATIFFEDSVNNR